MGHAMGLATDERFQEFSEKSAQIDKALDIITKTSITPDVINGLLASKGCAPLAQSVKGRQSAHPPPKLF